MLPEKEMLFTSKLNGETELKAKFKLKKRSFRPTHAGKHLFLGWEV